jgi:3-oxoacyl-[acyl-carrier-protein] synthase II
MRADPVVITGVGIEVPGLADPAGLLTAVDGPPASARFAPEEKLGRTGLLFKDRATRLALCASRDALIDAGLPVTAAAQACPETVGVVVSSNLGNLDTVCNAVAAIHRGGVKNTSPLDLPNASSNVIASTLAIRYGCRAVNLTLCNGATAGTEALHVAANCLRAGRAARVIVAGVEPRNDVVTRLLRESAASWLGSDEAVRPGEGAAAVVLEPLESARQRGARVYGRIGGYGFSGSADVEASVMAAMEGDGPPGLWLTANGAYEPTAKAICAALRAWRGRPVRRVDLGAALGEVYGALGVFQAVAACLLLEADGETSALLTSGAAWGDGAASLVIERGAA